jgi:hypothetical protein
MLVTRHEVLMSNQIYWSFTNNYNHFTNLRTLLFTIARIKSPQSAVSSPVVAW